MARAMMNAPMKRKTVESVNRPKTTSADVSPSSGGGVASSTTHSATPRSAAIGIGMASVSHQVITSARMAARLCWFCSRSNGISRTTKNSSGASHSPMSRRRRSKRSSAGDRRPACSSSVR